MFNNWIIMAQHRIATKILTDIVFLSCLQTLVFSASSPTNAAQNVCSGNNVPSCNCAYTQNAEHRVDCSNRQLKEVPAKIPTDVAILLLNDNSLTWLNSSHFRDLTQLRTLYLQSNSISSIQRGTFDYMYNLKLLIIQTNRLTEITSGLFYHLPNLIQLDLSNNLIERVERDAFLTLPNAQSIAMTGNPLKCDCETKALREWLTARLGQVTLDNAVCKNFQDTPLTRVADAKFGQCSGDGLFKTHSCYSCADARTHRECINSLNSQQACAPGSNMFLFLGK